jgi:ketosteroid isomerase-like protein
MVHRYLCCGLFCGIWISAAGAQTNAGLKEEVRKTEVAFAKTMADRDHAAFTTFLADETVFLGVKVLRGAKAVADQWKAFYQGAKAPFSWTPDAVEVLDSGTLALTSGPVFDPDGKRIGTFNSVWRLHPDGKWRIVFDKGCPACNCAQ